MSKAHAQRRCAVTIDGFEPPVTRREHRIMASDDFDERLFAEVDKVRFRLDEIALFLCGIEKILEKAVSTVKNMFWGMTIGYSIYAIIGHFLNK